MFRTSLRRFVTFSNLNLIKHCKTVYDPNKIKLFLIPNRRYEQFKCFSCIVPAYNQHVKEELDDVLKNLTDAYTNSRRIYAATIEHVLNRSTQDVLKNHGALLMKCCGTLILDQTLQSRQSLCDEIFAKLKSLNLVNVQHYNTYLQTCIENKMSVDYVTFLEEMSCEPNETTYRLLLKSVSEAGDVQQAVKIVAKMKESQFLANEELFNVLVLAYTINGGLNGVAPILKTMKSAHVTPSDKTFKAIVRGLAVYGDKNELINSLRTYSSVIQEQEFLDLLMILGVKGLHDWFFEVMEVTGVKQISKQSIDKCILMCIRLIHMRNTEAAFMYYKQFVEASSISDQGDYAFPLLYEMVVAEIETSKIIDVINELKREELNTVALEKLLGISLKEGFTKTAWELLRVMPNIRPHYFWPLLIKASEEHGEIGVLDVLEKMLKINVRPDTDTMRYYCLHLCDSKDPKELLLRLQKLGFTVREILTPLVSFLINKGRISSAANLCNQYNVIISSQHILPSLIRNWSFKSDVKDVVVILKKLSLHNKDSTSQVLTKILKRCKTLDHYKFYLNLVKAIKSDKLDINSTALDLILNLLRSKETFPILKEIELEVKHFAGDSIESSTIPHPRDMTLSELENQFIQLENKGMETRGVLRLLINEHCRHGNIDRAFELRDIFLKKGYQESAGMKTSLMHACVIKENLDNALDLYLSVKDRHPCFNIDEFKIIDLASLLVKNNKLATALEILSSEAGTRKIRGGPGLVRNCWKLLGSCNHEIELRELFSKLILHKYCSPTNIILGPLVKIHLKSNNLEKAVNVFKECVSQYNCTPLQLELLSALVKAEKLDMLQEVLNCSAQVHGSESMVVPCIASFAQNGLDKLLMKFLLETSSVSTEEMEKRCERWVFENNLFALETLAKACYSIKSNVIDRNVLYNSIMKIHSINNDCESAVSFYRTLIRKGIDIPKDVANELLQLVQRCKYELPAEL